MVHQEPEPGTQAQCYGLISGSAAILMVGPLLSPKKDARDTAAILHDLGTMWTRAPFEHYDARGPAPMQWRLPKLSRTIPTSSYSTSPSSLTEEETPAPHHQYAAGPRLRHHLYFPTRWSEILCISDEVTGMRDGVGRHRGGGGNDDGAHHRFRWWAEN